MSDKVGIDELRRAAAYSEGWRAAMREVLTIVGVVRETTIAIP